MSQLGTFLDTPIDEKSRKELLDAIKSARKNPPIRQERNLSSSGLAPMIVQKHLRKVDKAYKDNDYGTVIRIGAELARKGVDWDPALLARCSISFAVCMDGPLTCQFALASIQLNPEQAPAYIALAMLKSSARMFNDALILYDIGKTALNVPTSLCDELYPEIIWNQRINNEKVRMLHDLVHKPGVLNSLKTVPELSKAFSCDWTIIDAAVASSAGDVEDWISSYEMQAQVRRFNGEAWAIRRRIESHLWSAHDNIQSQNQSALVGINCVIFQHIVKHDVRLAATLGTTCRTLWSWTLRIDTWRAMASQVLPLEFTDIMDYPEDLMANWLTSPFPMKMACTAMLKSQSTSELLSFSRDFIERFRGSPTDMYRVPFRGLIGRMGEWMVMEKSPAYAHYLLDQVPELVPALLKYSIELAQPIVFNVTTSTLVTLLLRCGPKILRQFDLYGLQSFFTCLLFCDGYLQFAALHAAAYGYHYLTQYANPLTPLFLSTASLRTVYMSRIEALSKKERLCGTWALVLVPFSHVRSFSSDPSERDDIFKLFANGAHLCSQEDSQLPADQKNALHSLNFQSAQLRPLLISDTDIQHAIIKLTFEREAIEGDGHFVGARGPLRLTPGQSYFNLAEQLFYASFEDQTAGEINILNGSPHPMGFGGIWSSQSVSDVDGSKGESTAKGTWCLCKLQEVGESPLPEVATTPNIIPNGLSLATASKLSSSLDLFQPSSEADDIRNMMVDLQFLARATFQLASPASPAQSLLQLAQRVAPFDSETRKRWEQKAKLPKPSEYESTKGHKNRLSLYIDACSAQEDLRKFFASKFASDIKLDLPILRRVDANPLEDEELLRVLSKWQRLLCIHTYEIAGLVNDREELAAFLEQALHESQRNQGKHALLLSKVRPVQASSRIESHYLGDKDSDVDDVDSAENLFKLRKQGPRGKNRNSETSISTGWIIAGAALIVATVASIAVFAGMQSTNKKRRK